MSKRYNVGDKVKVNKDIVRLERNDVGHEFQPYAVAGEFGTIVEIFHANGGSKFRGSRLHAKVCMTDGNIKTFRLTSLEKL